MTEHVPVYVPLDKKLTQRVKQPAVPAPACVDLLLRPTICGEALQDFAERMIGALKAANSKLAEIESLQPESKP